MFHVKPLQIQNPTTMVRPHKYELYIPFANMA